MLHGAAAGDEDWQEAGRRCYEPFAQGFLLCRPQPAEAFADFVCGHQAASPA